MPKQKKITVQPFLHEEKKNSFINLDNGGELVQAFPLYYKVIYNTRSNHIVATGSHGGRVSAYAFKDLSPDARDCYSNVLASDVIKRDTRVIELTVRYFEKNNMQFDLKGMKDHFVEWGDNLFSDVNDKMKRFLRDKLSDSDLMGWNELFNYKNGNLSFYFVFTTLQKGIDIFKLLSPAELHHIQNIKRFFELYEHKFPGEHDSELVHPDNHLGLYRNSMKFSKIQWVMNDMRSEYEAIASEAKVSDTDMRSIAASVNWSLDLVCRRLN